MNNGILSQDVYGKIGFSNNLPQPLAGSPGVVQLPYHFPPNNEWRKNLDQCLVLVYDTSKRNNLTVSLPYGVQSFATDIIIDWGDGLFDKIYWTDTGNSRSSSHTYSSHGIYTVIVSGRLGRLGQSVVGGNFTAITKCLSFGNLGLVNLYNGFGSFSNLIEAPTTIPSGVTDISFLFNGCTNFNDPKINYWNTSNIANMSYAFTLAINFNQPLNNWNTNSVTTMYNMFAQAYKFNQDLSSWNMSGVNNITQMFYGASSFNNGGSSGIMNWNISSQATNLNGMFYSCTSFDQPLDNWNVSKVTNMNALFQGASVFNNGGSSGINNWNTSSLNSMQQTFQAPKFNQPLGNWNVSGVTNMYLTFYTASSFNQPLINWNTSSATTMQQMFQNASSFNQNLDNWNVRKVTTFASMFNTATNFNGSLSGWALGADTSGTSCQSMFQSATSFNQDLSSWDTSKVTNMNRMFTGVRNFNGDITSWNTSSVTDMTEALSAEGGIFNQNISGWDTSKVTTMASMFRGNGSFNQPIGSWNVSNVNSMSYMFAGLGGFRSPFSQDISSWDIRKVTTMDTMFQSNALWGTTNYSNALIAWAALPDTNLNSQTITAFAASSTNTLVTSNNHGLVAGSRVNITGTTNYNGDYNVVSVPNTNQFVIAKTFVANDATGTMNHRRSRNVIAGFATNKYSAGAAADARSVLINTYGWTITDGGQA